MTRDRKELVCEWAGTEFRLIDTGGVDVADRVADHALDRRPGARGGRGGRPRALRRRREGRDHARRRGGRGDPARRRASRSSCSRTRSTTRRATREALEFHRLGLGDPIPLSALHGHGTGDLLDAIVARLPGAGPAQVGEEAIRVAILGRPNVGKSSLLNAILGEERVIVSDVPGTTRDAIDTVLRARRHDASSSSTPPGLRRKRRQRQGIEYYSELRALDAADRADVALVLVDASEGLVDQDLAVADVARKANCSTLVVLSKWDIGAGEGRGRAAAARASACASARGSSPSRRRPAAASPACSTGSSSCTRSTRAGSRRRR